MRRIRPFTKGELSNVEGLGSEKINRYGQAIVDVSCRLVRLGPGALILLGGDYGGLL